MFDYDKNKSNTNKSKHGIDFEHAQLLWEDECRLEIPARTTGEARFVVIGRIGVVLWCAVITYRGERVRIISVRRARKKEVTFYESI